MRPHAHDHQHGGHHHGGHHQGGHHHGGACGGLDHHDGNYTSAQRRDLELVLDFNRRMSEAINAGLDVAATEAALDPDPLRYMWVDEGQGQIEAQLTAADEVLAAAASLRGKSRDGVQWIEESARAARPSMAAGADGTTLTVWLEWVPERGEILRARREEVDGSFVVEDISTDPIDLFRPSAVIDGDGRCWAFVGRRDTPKSPVAIWGTCRLDSGWSPLERISDTAHPSFNQEVARAADGSMVLCWQARHESRFAIFTRTHTPAGWGNTEIVTAGIDANVWDPALTTRPDGGTVFAWSEYAHGSYRIQVRERSAAGQWGDPRPITAGSDYALHPSLAVTADGRLWCAFDQIVMHGHGGSGPTRLRAAADVGADPTYIPGVRPSGDSVPAELIPEVAAGVQVVEVLADGVRPAPGELTAGLDVVPSGLPKLAATADGGLVVAYRVHRRLPLMTYYWEIAAQSLGLSGWEPPTSYSGTDGTLEEVSIVAVGHGVRIAAQMDRRLERALTWTEGFGGRECPYLYEHHGSIIWHGTHGLGQIVMARLASSGPVWSPGPATAEVMACTSGVPALEVQASEIAELVQSDTRTESRRWVLKGGHKIAGHDRRLERPSTQVGSETMHLYWGDLHRHSLVSRCTSGDEPSLDDFYRYAWDVNDYDFWAVTDHAENSSDYQWWGIQKIADLFHIPGAFVPFYGFEWTSADTGHQNVIFGDVERGAPTFSAFAEGTTDPAGLWKALGEHPAYPAITIPHHPGAAMVYNDWDYHDSTYSRLVEIFQACRGNYEGPGSFRQYSDGTATGTFTIDGLLRGHRFGFVGSSDHGHGASYVGAWARSLERAEVFEALQARRTFAASTRDVTLDVRLSGSDGGEAFMGEEAHIVGEPTIHIAATGYADLARLEVVRDGVTVHEISPQVAAAGEIVVNMRVEWGKGEGETVWDGALSMDGGRVLATPWWSPDVIAADEHSLAWQNSTYSFGEPYGAQRGAVELTLVGPATARVEVMIGERSLVTTLGAIKAAFASGQTVNIPGSPGLAGTVCLQHSVGGLTSLGSRQVQTSWTDDRPEHAAQVGLATFYYVRAYLVDGEMAWSSPIWITPTTAIG
ncbi:MAG: DUF3604 domain-containing protein [Ornithinimicrobium sp.]